MKRDCGKGELIPVKWVIYYCPNAADKEIKQWVEGPDSTEFERIANSLEMFGNVRLYAQDKQGYMNCIRSAHRGSKGLEYLTDRRSELP